MNNCLNCETPLEHLQGKRKKKFCNDTCRSNYWQKNNKKEQPQYVSFKTFQALKDKMDLLMLKTGQKETITITKDSKVAKEEKNIGTTGNNKKWKQGDPNEGSNGFYLRFGVFKYDDENFKRK